MNSANQLGLTPAISHRLAKLLKLSQQLLISQPRLRLANDSPCRMSLRILFAAASPVATYFWPDIRQSKGLIAEEFGTLRAFLFVT